MTGSSERLIDFGSTDLPETPGRLRRPSRSGSRSTCERWLLDLCGPGCAGRVEQQLYSADDFEVRALERHASLAEHVAVAEVKMPMGRLVGVRGLERFQLVARSCRRPS